MKTAIIIPTYNERENIGRLVSQLAKLLPEAAIIVVDDNSPDGTAKIVLSKRKKNSNIHLLLRKNKAGRGQAVLAGFAYALKNTDAKLFVEMDADFSHDPSELQTLLEQTELRTVVLASRYVRGSRIVDWPFIRRVTSFLSNLLIRIVLNLPAKDNTNGYRIYGKDAIRILLKHRFVTSGYIVLSESGYVLRKHGFAFREIPTIFVNRKRGKSNASFREFTESLVALWRIRFSFSP